MAPESAQEQINTRALEKAQRAETLIEQHLDECRRNNEMAHAERADARREVLDGFGRVDQSISKVHRRVDQMGGRWIALAGAVILILLGVIGYLYDKSYG